MTYLKRSFLALLVVSVSLMLSCVPDSNTTDNTPSTTKPKTTAKGETTNTNTSAPKQATKVPSFNADSAYAYIQKQVDFGFRVPGTPEQKACADWLAAKSRTFADRVIVQEATVKVHTGKEVPMYNIIASFNPDAKERILLCAHWDTRPIADQDNERQDEPIVGANDGGSGVGVLLEIARQLKATPVSYGIDIIFFDVEDYGVSGADDSYCLGSQYWGKTPHVPNYTAKYGILLDMVGAGDAIFLKEQISLAYAKPIVDKVWKKAQDLGFGSYFSNEVTPSPITDDHYYVNDLRKIPTIDIIHYTNEGNFGDFWHTHDDDMNIINKSTLKVVGKTLMHILYEEGINL